MCPINLPNEMIICSLRARNENTYLISTRTIPVLLHSPDINKKYMKAAYIPEGERAMAKI